MNLRFGTGDPRSLLWPLESLGDFPCGSASKESACNAGDLGSIPGLGRSPGEGKGYPLQYSGLENSMDSIVHGVPKSRTRLSEFLFTSGILWLWHINSQQHVGSSSMIRDRTQAPALGTWSLSPWTTREVLKSFHFNAKIPPPKSHSNFPSVSIPVFLVQASVISLLDPRFPHWLSSKESTHNAGATGDMGLIPRKIPSRRAMATHSSILAWRIPWTEEPGELQSIGLYRVQH